MWSSVLVERWAVHGGSEGVSNILEVQAKLMHQLQVLALQLSSNDAMVQEPLKAV